MKTKKTKRANLENRRAVFFQIGMILSLSAILAAFEWKSEVKDIQISTIYDGEDITEYEIPRTPPQKDKLKAMPPKPVINFKIVSDPNVEIIDEPPIIDDGIDWPTDFNIFDKTPETVVDSEYVQVEIMPTFQGKEAKYFRNFIAKNIKFPEDAVKNGVNGKVNATFVVDTDGSIQKVEILRGVHPVIDQAVMNLINNSPKWEPGIQEGRYVKVRYSISIAFKLKNI